MNGWNTKGQHSFAPPKPTVQFNDLETVGEIPMWSTKNSTGALHVTITEKLPENGQASIGINMRVFKQSAKYNGPDKNGLMVKPEVAKALVPLLLAAIARYEAVTGTTVPAADILDYTVAEEPF